VTQKTIGLYPAPVLPAHCELKSLMRMNLSGSVACCGADGDEKLPRLRVGIPRKVKVQDRGINEPRFE
jgi:hypothetical protein